jgi:hypothetical protein
MATTHETKLALRAAWNEGEAPPGRLHRLDWLGFPPATGRRFVGMERGVSPAKFERSIRRHKRLVSFNWRPNRNAVRCRPLPIQVERETEGCYTAAGGLWRVTRDGGKVHL